MRLGPCYFLVVAILCPTLFADPPAGSLCVAPVPREPDPRSALGLTCKPEKLSFRIDSMAEKSWPLAESLKIDGLDVSVKHRVVVTCGGKAQQSFEFRHSDYKTTKLCLFINDLYKTAQLWDHKASPWCKCK